MPTSPIPGVNIREKPRMWPEVFLTMIRARTPEPAGTASSGTLSVSENAGSAPSAHPQTIAAIRPTTDRVLKLLVISARFTDRRCGRACDTADFEFPTYAGKGHEQGRKVCGD